MAPRLQRKTLLKSLEELEKEPTVEAHTHRHTHTHTHTHRHTHTIKIRRTDPGLFYDVFVWISVCVFHRVVKNSEPPFLLKVPFLNKCVSTGSGSGALCSSSASRVFLTLSLTITTWQPDWWNMLCRLEAGLFGYGLPDRALTQGSTCVFLRVCWQVGDCSRAARDAVLGKADWCNNTAVLSQTTVWG